MRALIFAFLLGSSVAKANYTLDLAVGTQAQGTLIGEKFLKTSFGISHYFKEWLLSTQVSYLRSPESGDGAVSVQQEAWELMGWGKYRFVREQSYAVYVGAGGGFRNEQVSTSLFFAPEVQKSRLNWLLGATVGGLISPFDKSSSFYGLKINLELQTFRQQFLDAAEIAFIGGLGIGF